MTDSIVWPTEPPIAGGPPAPTQPEAYEPPRLPGEPGSPPPPEDGRRAVASPWTRLGALCLEMVLFGCTFGFGWVGWWIVAWADGQSPSKMVLHLHVVRADDGTVASFGRMAVREAIGKAPAGVAVVAGLYFRQPWLVGAAAAYVVVSAAFASRDARRRTLWDRLAGTVVLEGDPPAPAPAPPAPLTPPVERSTSLG